MTGRTVMGKAKIVHPQYAEQFRCVGPDCEDSCCAGWDIPVDRAAYEKCQSVPAGPLRTLIDASIAIAPDGPGGEKAKEFARIKVLPSHHCPFHNAERLCQIQAEHGAEYLSRTCARFPRATCVIDRFEETTLMLSCPEAARIVLTDPALFAGKGETAHMVRWDENPAGEIKLRSYFWPIRDFSVALLRNRAYPLWQRMFLLGTFSRRLEAIVERREQRGFPAMLREFSAAVASGSLRASIDTIPVDLDLQLRMVIDLASAQRSGTQLPARLAECFRVFLEGIGYGSEASMQGNIARYAEAYRRYYAPFFLSHRHMLENYLVNAIFQCLFPFGAGLFDPDATPAPVREFATIATEFGLIKGLLIGVAGSRKEAFSAQDVIETVQSVVRYLGNHPQYRANAHRLLVEKNLDNARGLTMLLRN